MEIILNGETKAVPVGMTLAALLQDLNQQSRYVAVERNLNLVPRAQHADCVLQPGDRLEIVTLVGGG